MSSRNSAGIENNAILWPFNVMKIIFVLVNNALYVALGTDKWCSLWAQFEASTSIKCAIFPRNFVSTRQDNVESFSTVVVSIHLGNVRRLRPSKMIEGCLVIQFSQWTTGSCFSLWSMSKLMKCPMISTLTSWLPAGRNRKFVMIANKILKCFFISSANWRIKGEKCFQLVFESEIYDRNYLFKH